MVKIEISKRRWLFLLLNLFFAGNALFLLYFSYIAYLSVLRDGQLFQALAVVLFVDCTVSAGLTYIYFEICTAWLTEFTSSGIKWLSIKGKRFVAWEDIRDFYIQAPKEPAEGIIIITSKGERIRFLAAAFVNPQEVLNLLEANKRK